MFMTQNKFVRGTMNSKGIWIKGSKMICKELKKNNAIKIFTEYEYIKNLIILF